MSVSTTFDSFRTFLSGASAESWAKDGCRPKNHPRQRYIRDIADEKVLQLHYIIMQTAVVKAIPLQAWTDPEDSRRVSFPYFKAIGTRKW
jgi:hypothetical protein